MRDLTQHLTARADDSHAAPLQPSRRRPDFHRVATALQAQVRFFALHRIKPHAPPLVRVPVNSFEFQPCDRTPQAGYLMRLLRHCSTKRRPTPSIQRLQRGLPGYLILFAPHAFAPQRQLRARKPPSLPVFFLISTHFTATPGIPLSSPALKNGSFKGRLRVKPVVCTSDIPFRLHALYAQ